MEKIIRTNSPCLISEQKKNISRENKKGSAFLNDKRIAQVKGNPLFYSFQYPARLLRGCRQKRNEALSRYPDACIEEYGGLHLYAMDITKFNNGKNYKDK